MFVDSHAHLEMPQFSADRAAVLEQARDAGVEAVLAIGSGSGPEHLTCAIDLAEQFASGDAAGSATPRLFASIGIHPHEAAQAADQHFQQLESLARHARVIAWGEIGLDYFYDHSPRQVQRAVFIRQTELAGAARLPLIIHCRPSENGHDAWEDCFRLLHEHWKASGLGGIFHCFTGTLEDAWAALDLGFLVSFAGNVTFPKAENIRAAARDLPLDRILIETDSPFLAPVPHRGQRNEPAFVREVARRVAELRGMDAEELGAYTSRNFYRFFRLER